MKICLNCGNVSDNDMLFCDVCGKDHFDHMLDVVCPHCGATNAQANIFCNDCGKELSKPNVAIEQKAIRNKLAETYTAEISSVEVKETSKCPNCGNEVQINAIFCYECGTPIYTMHDHKVVSRKVCGHCNTPNLMTSSLCTNCYGALDDASIVEYQVVHETRTAGMHNVRYAVLRGAHERHLMCNSCGAINDINADLCSQCGLKLRVEEQVKYCPVCGASNNADAQFCSSCQSPMAGYYSATHADNVWVCSHCNNVNTDNDNFCTKCGNKNNG